MCHGGKFQSLDAAMAFIARHCAVHHNAFNRALARTYLPFCRLLDLVKGSYVVPEHLSKKEFDRAVAIAMRWFVSVTGPQGAD
jgi:hypothetical protein